MDAIKCDQCGAALTSESRFCNFCGAKIPDNIERSEHKYIDEAELKRVEYEKQMYDDRIAREDAARKAYKKKRLYLMILALTLPLVVAGFAYALIYIAPGFGTTMLAALVFVGAIILWFVFGIITLIRYLKA